MTAAELPPACAALHLVADELALGLLEGPARADAVAHVDSCADCRHHVHELARLVDDLLVAGPEAEPSPGFEGRVLAELTPPHHGRRGRRGRTLALAAAVIVALLLAGGLGVRARMNTDAEFVRAAAMVTPTGSRVGRVDVATNPDTVLIALPAWDDAPSEQEANEYHLRVTLRDGQSQDLGPFALKPGKDMWSTRLGVDAQRVTSVAVVDEHGGTMCIGTFAA